ncbi:metalloregulator ArsR/SmtB family transcription factor [Conexibacter sp. CPCC 206217]|nr:metalloregulator ArsR/SmtB family transcription factor [Conexibacter sp. CPCC 206217]
MIADPTRVRLMWALDELGGATVQQLADRLMTTHQNTSKHLATLYQTGLVARTREGTRMRYILADWTALWLVEQIAASALAQVEDQHRALVGEEQSEHRTA